MGDKSPKNTAKATKQKVRDKAMKAASRDNAPKK